MRSFKCVGILIVSFCFLLLFGCSERNSMFPDDVSSKEICLVLDDRSAIEKWDGAFYDLNNTESNVQIKVVQTMDFSHEGALLKALYRDEKLISLNVQIFGETFREIRDYQFNDNLIIISITTVMYEGSITFHPGSDDVIFKTIEYNHMLLQDGILYSFSREGEPIILEDSQKNDCIKMLHTFLDKFN